MSKLIKLTFNYMYHNYGDTQFVDISVQLCLHRRLHVYAYAVVSFVEISVYRFYFSYKSYFFWNMFSLCVMKTLDMLYLSIGLSSTDIHTVAQQDIILSSFFLQNKELNVRSINIIFGCVASRPLFSV